MKWKEVLLKMKKILGTIALAMMVLLPITVNAAIGGNITCDDLDQDTKTKTCYITGSATNGDSLTEYTGTLKLVNAAIVSITPASGWTDASSGTNLKFTSSTEVSGSSFKVATIVFSYTGTAGEKCTITFTPCYTSDGEYTCGTPTSVEESYTCKVVNGTYYGKDGSVVTADVYNSECADNPQTGSFVPYAVIISGLALAVVVFTVSRRNTKLYKI